MNCNYIIIIIIPSLTTVSTEASDPNSDAILMLGYICFNSSFRAALRLVSYILD